MRLPLSPDQVTVKARPSHQDGHVDVDIKREQDREAATGGLRACLAL